VSWCLGGWLPHVQVMWSVGWGGVGAVGPWARQEDVKLSFSRRGRREYGSLAERPPVGKLSSARMETGLGWCHSPNRRVAECHSFADFDVTSQLQSHASLANELDCSSNHTLHFRFCVNEIHHLIYRPKKCVLVGDCVCVCASPTGVFVCWRCNMCRC
jgi:hypothetical protein